MSDGGNKAVSGAGASLPQGNDIGKVNQERRDPRFGELDRLIPIEELRADTRSPAAASGKAGKALRSQRTLVPDLAEAIIEAAGRIRERFHVDDRLQANAAGRLLARTLAPPQKRRRGRPPKERIDKALQAYMGGARRLNLYKVAIPGFAGMTHYRRLAESRKLHNAIQKRLKRARLAAATKSP